MIEISNLTKRYGSITAIKNINFTVNKGEIVGFLGPNGAGKTTTMKIITGFMAPSSGSVKVAGFDVFENPLDVKRRIGYLPETPPVYTDMYVEDYLKYVGALKGLRGVDITQGVKRAIERANLGPVSRRLIGNLSKGFRQRVGIAQALVHNPEVLILDEPTVGLDPKQVIEIRNLIKELAGDHTVVLSINYNDTSDLYFILSK
jgi:ABC-2 type transport system ATP-binding protein